MDEREVKLSQELANAMNRWLGLEKRYTENLPPIRTWIPGQPLEVSDFVFDAAHRGMMADLRDKAARAYVDYNTATVAYRAYVSARRL